MLFVAAASLSAFAQPDGYNEFLMFRELRDKSFANPETSPLLQTDREMFRSLCFFDFDPRYRVKASVRILDEKSVFLFPTTTGSARKYLKIAELSFVLDGSRITLSGYRLESGAATSDLFVPFRDETNSEETYSAGRYLYVSLGAKGDTAVVDFNVSYNPSCAYGDASFSCALPPKENFLKTGIRAGEKRFVSNSNCPKPQKS